jgi:hypothetical protein
MSDIPKEYEQLNDWAQKHRLAFKVQNEPDGETLLWMSDAIDGHLRAECVAIDDDGPTWLGYRFRLRKNEQFLSKFMQLTDKPDCDWLGHGCNVPSVRLPAYHKIINMSWQGRDGQVFILDNKTSVDTEEYLTDCGCTMLWSTPQYAPEIRYRAVFVPRGTEIEPSI